MGGIFCAAGDLPFVLKDRGNEKIGMSGNIDNN